MVKSDRIVGDDLVLSTPVPFSHIDPLKIDGKDSNGANALLLILLLPCLILIGVAVAVRRRKQRRNEIRRIVGSLRRPSVFLIAEHSTIKTGPKGTVQKPTKRTQQKSNENATETGISDYLYNDFSHLPKPVYRNNRNPIRLVPFTLLPPDFDFASPEIEVRCDFVIIKEVTISTHWKKEPPPYNEAVTNPTKRGK